MQFKSVIGHNQVKSKLISTYKDGRIAHTQLFLGDEGAGPLPMAIAYAQYLLCSNKQENDSCGECPSCKKFKKFAHPDVHFYFPTATNKQVTTKPKSSLVLDTWRKYLIENDGYITLNGWLEFLGVGNKQGFMRVHDAEEIIDKVVLKSYEGGFKIIIIYMLDLMNEQASNKLLKTLEEPPENTIILLTSNSYEQLLPTVRSRTQLIKIVALKPSDIVQALEKDGLEKSKAEEIAVLSNGNWILAKEIAANQDEEHFNFINFRNWLRLCFQPKDYTDLFKFNQDIAKLGRENLKSFLGYGLEVIRNSLLNNNGHSSKIRKAGEELEFSKKFAPYINSSNQNELYKLFSDAIFHVKRNAHHGILMSDMSFKIIQLLAKGRTAVKKS